MRNCTNVFVKLSQFKFLMAYDVCERSCFFMAGFIIFILGIFGFAFFIDLRRKINNNYPQIPTNPSTKPGENTNYMMGDNKYTNGE